MSSRIITRLLAGLVAALTVGALVATPAHAEVWQVRDGDNPRRNAADISLVRVDHAPRNVFTDVRFHQNSGYDEMHVLIDTRPRNRGPEFALWVTMAENRGGTAYALYRINAFGDAASDHRLFATGRSVRCRGAEARWVWRGPQQDMFTTKVPRSCLATRGTAPRKVRVSVRAFSDRVRDWAPGRREFGRWVGRG